MLQCEWPEVWSTESREAVRVAIEVAIRKAMAGSTNSKIRGVVNVDLPYLGSSPPELVLSGIRELSVERTALMVKLRYNGGFSVTLRGLQINLDTIGSSGEEADANLALPFYCPFEMTLHDILIDGVASIELLQELEETTGSDGSETRGPGNAAERPSSSAASAAAASHCVNASSVANELLLQAGRAAASTSRPPSTGASSGYGVLLGAGGRRAMRPPEALVEDLVGPAPGSMGSQSHSPSLPGLRGTAGSGGGGGGDGGVGGVNNTADTLGVPPGGGGTAGHSGAGIAAGASDGAAADDAKPLSSSARHSIFDVLSKKVSVKRRAVRLQFFGDPLKNLSVASNFGSVPGANNKVEGTIKMLIKPSIVRLMTEGITIYF